jgi:hypothetical protein
MLLMLSLSLKVLIFSLKLKNKKKPKETNEKIQNLNKCIKLSFFNKFLNVFIVDMYTYLLPNSF